MLNETEFTEVYYDLILCMNPSLLIADRCSTKEVFPSCRKLWKMEDEKCEVIAPKQDNFDEDGSA